VAFVKIKLLTFAVFFVSSVCMASGLEEFSRLSEENSLEGSEISAYIPSQKMLFSTTGECGLTAISLAEPAHPKILFTKKFRGEVPSISSYKNWLAVAEMAVPATSSGIIHLYEVIGDTLKLLKTFQTGAHPDMVAFSPIGTEILVACEGEIDEETKADPEGSIGLIDLSKGIEKANSAVLRFDVFDSLSLSRKGVRLGGPGSYLQNIEPEYAAFSKDGKWGFVSLQENNAIAKIDMKLKKIADVFALGAVDHALPGNAFDFRRDKKISLENPPVLGLRQPDGIAAYENKGKTYVFTADEGAEREFSFYSDVASAKALLAKGVLDSSVFTSELIKKLGDLPLDASKPCDQVPCKSAYTFGGRTMSVFDGESGKLVWTSGSKIEEYVAKVKPEIFNQNSKKEKPKMDSRSNKKGPEPENVVIQNIGNKSFAFLGLERTSGIVVWEVINPENSKILGFFANSKDRGPEGILFIEAKDSPLLGIPLLIVSYEYSKTLVIYKVLS